MEVLFVAAEGTPLVKVGGLADVIGSLPKALNQSGHDVRIMLPRYGIIDTDRFPLLPVIDDVRLQVVTKEKKVSLKVTELWDKVKVYLVDSDDFSNSGEVYGKADLERFLLFCRSVFDMLSRLDWQPEVIHCHDWHTALIPMWVKREGLKYATVFTIHNLAYQGSFDHTFLAHSELDKDWQLWPPDAPEPVLNFMSQGILWADVVTTVSKTYAKEILTPEYGEGLERLLCYRREQLVGIVNGLDYEEYNPAADRFIPVQYDVSTVEKKLGNKLALQRHAGLTEDMEVPLIGMVSRLDEQKGLDIVIESFDYFFQETKAQMIILGRGREQYHSLLKQVADRYPERLAVFIEFNDILARLIYAGCDIFLMPSRFEPCGLGQLIAMRYGAVPVVRHTGGLADTVEDLTPDLRKGSGFAFKDYDSESMLVAVKRAVESYRRKEAWWGVVRRIMALDFSWQASAKKYESLYRSLLEQKKHVMG